MILISIIVCTRNRVQYLKKCISSLLSQSFSKDSYEIIVVDNNSEDETKLVVQGFMKESNAPIIKYVFESKLGLSVARNTGIKNSEGQIVAFIDDDAIASTDWVSEIYRCFENNSVQVAGGRVDLIWESSKPHWIIPEMETQLTKIDWGDEIKEIKLPDEWLAGANIAFRKELFDNYSFSPLLGRIGNSLLSGEEIEICYKVQERDGKILYNPRALVKHNVIPDRVNLSFFRKRSLLGGTSEVIMRLKLLEKKYSLKDILIILRRIIVNFIKFILSIPFKRKRFKYELEFIYQFGMLISIIRYSLYRNN